MATDCCTEASLRDFDALAAEVANDDEAAIELLAHPRRFMKKRGFSLPPDAEISFLPTEELEERLRTPAGVRNFVATEMQPKGVTITIHVQDGIAKCTTVKFK